MNRDDEQRRMENETAYLLQRGQSFAERAGLPLPAGLTIANLPDQEVTYTVTPVAEEGIGPEDDALCCPTCGRPNAMHGINCPSLLREDSAD